MRPARLWNLARHGPGEPIPRSVGENTQSVSQGECAAEILRIEPLLTVLGCISPRPRFAPAATVIRKTKRIPVRVPFGNPTATGAHNLDWTILRCPRSDNAGMENCCIGATLSSRARAGRLAPPNSAMSANDPVNRLRPHLAEEYTWSAPEPCAPAHFRTTPAPDVWAGRGRNLSHPPV